jgi:hypothetical protein
VRVFFDNTDVGLVTILCSLAIYKILRSRDLLPIIVWLRTSYSLFRCALCVVKINAKLLRICTCISFGSSASQTD